MVDVAYFALGAGSFTACYGLYLIGKGLFLEEPYTFRKLLGKNPKRSDLIIDNVATILPFPLDKAYASIKKSRTR